MRRPLVLVGETSSRRIVERLRALGWGRLFTDRRPKLYPGEPWGFDNGAYAAYLARAPFPAAAFRRRLKRDNDLRPPYLAVLPDIVGGGVDSLRFSLAWRDELPEWPWYLAVQDGMTTHHVRPYLDDVAGLFLGGTNAFKGTAPKWRRLAAEHGKRFHYGRAGTLSKLSHAIEVGADSLDSAFPLWTTDRFESFAHHWQHDPQGRLWGDAT